MYDSRENCNAIIETASNTLNIGCKNTMIPNSVTTIGSYAFANCSSLSSITIPNSVTSIGNNAFKGCIGLASIEIPNSVKEIEYKVFNNCTSLTSITIPNSITAIGEDAFEGCTNLNKVIVADLASWCAITFRTEKSNPLYYAKHMYSDESTEITDLVIPDGVTSISQYAFKNCAGFSSITIPDNVTSIDSYAFAGCSGATSLTLSKNLTNITSYSFYGMTGLGRIYIPGGVKTIGDNAFYGCTDVTYVRIPGSVISIGSNAFQQNQKKQKVGNSYYITLTTFNIDPGSYAQLWVFDKSWAFDVFYPFVQSKTTTASSLEFQFQKPLSNVEITLFEVNGISVGLNDYSLKMNGLEPKSEYTINYKIIANGSTFTFKDIYQDYQKGQNWHAMYSTYCTDALNMITQQPKVISLGNVIVAATSNLDDAEENVGFEWRRTDWSDDFASNTGQAYLYEGTMEGYIRNLNTEKLWKYRPYYLSDSGTYYYGDWVGIDPTNTSYFEPTVHTYAAITIEGNTALVKGYALRGTDNITVQGFKYWKNASGARGGDHAPLLASAIPADAQTVEAEGYVMEASLTGLDFNSEYCYVAFVKTSEGETFYGEQRTFTTGEDPTGIDGIRNDSANGSDVHEVARYNMQGLRITSPERGLNIVRMSDGTVRKVMVK